MTERKSHDQSAPRRLRQSFVEAADEITERLERLESCMQPSFPSVDSRRVEPLHASHEQLQSTVNALNTEVADLSYRLERMECLLMCSNLTHVNKIDKLLRKLKEEAGKQSLERLDEESPDKLVSVEDETVAPCGLERSERATTFSDSVPPAWSEDSKRPELLAMNADKHESPPQSITEATAARSDLDFADTASISSSIATASALVDHSACPNFDVSDLLSNDRHGTDIEQARRFWKGMEENKRTPDEFVVTLGDHSPTLKPKPDTTVVSSEEAPAKQFKTKGWNLKAEAAAQGKRIEPKKESQTSVQMRMRGLKF